MKKRISIEDIAKELGISKTSISWIINGKAKENRIGEALEKRVLDHIAKVGYQPNQFARGLRTGKTNTIAVLVEDISDPFFAGIVRIIEESAYTKGYKIVCSSTENDTKKTKDIIAAFRSRQVDGFIIAPPPGIEEDIEGLLSDNFPVVLFDRYFPSVPTDNITVDNYQGTYDAISYFYECGHKNIGFVTLISDQIQMQERLNGYMKATDDYKADYYIKRIGFDQDRESTVSDIKKFLKSNKALDGLFFSTNYLAYAGIEAIQSLGLKVPDQLGVIVFDDEYFFRLFNPPITAVEQPTREISENVIDLMLNKLTTQGKQMERKNIVLPTKLIIRKSTKNYEAVKPILNEKFDEERSI